MAKPAEPETETDVQPAEAESTGSRRGLGRVRLSLAAAGTGINGCSPGSHQHGCKRVQTAPIMKGYKRRGCRRMRRPPRARLLVPASPGHPRHREGWGLAAAGVGETASRLRQLRAAPCGGGSFRLLPAAWGLAAAGAMGIDGRDRRRGGGSKNDDKKGCTQHFNPSNRKRRHGRPWVRGAKLQK